MIWKSESGLALWAGKLGSCTEPEVQTGPRLGLMCCCCHLEILNLSFFKLVFQLHKHRIPLDPWCMGAEWDETWSKYKGSGRAADSLKRPRFPESQSSLRTRTQKEGHDVLRTTNDQGAPSNLIHSRFMLPPCIPNHLHWHRMKEKRG